MKLKYQMRGLGIGIIVTALLMGVATRKGIPLSDAEIRAKALELGMVDSDSLKLTDLPNVSGTLTETSMSQEDSGTDGDGVPDGDSAATIGGEDLDSTENTVGEESLIGTENVTGQGNTAASETMSGLHSESNTDVTSGQGGSMESGETDSQRSPLDQVDATEAGGEIQIVIEFGMTSAHVSDILEEAGLVEDAGAFDEYLCSNGFSRKITAGTYRIAPGTDEEEIIKIITKNG